MRKSYTLPWALWVIGCFLMLVSAGSASTFFVGVLNAIAGVSIAFIRTYLE